MAYLRQKYITAIKWRQKVISNVHKIGILVFWR